MVTEGDDEYSLYTFTVTYCSQRAGILYVRNTVVATYCTTSLPIHILRILTGTSNSYVI